MSPLANPRFKIKENLSHKAHASYFRGVKTYKVY